MTCIFLVLAENAGRCILNLSGHVSCYPSLLLLLVFINSLKTSSAVLSTNQLRRDPFRVDVAGLTPDRKREIERIWPGHISEIQSYELTSRWSVATLRTRWFSRVIMSGWRPLVPRLVPQNFVITRCSGIP